MTNLGPMSATGAYVHSYELDPGDPDEWRVMVKRHLSLDHQWPAAPIEEAEAIHDSLHEEDSR